MCETVYLPEGLHIAWRYNGGMKRDIRNSDYVALAEMRHRIRQFIRGSDEAAEAEGLAPQQYQLLLALRALPRLSDATIGRLAESLSLRPHSVVGMVDRLEAKRYVCRKRSVVDKREVFVVLLPRGRNVLKKVVGQRVHELRSSGQSLVDSITAILKRNRETKSRRPVSDNAVSEKSETSNGGVENKNARGRRT